MFNYHAFERNKTIANKKYYLPLQQILLEWLCEVAADPPQVQNVLLPQLESQHHPKHPSKDKDILIRASNHQIVNYKEKRK